MEHDTEFIVEELVYLVHEEIRSEAELASVLLGLTYHLGVHLLSCEICRVPKDTISLL